MRNVFIILWLFTVPVLLTSCASDRTFTSEADERLFRSIEKGGDINAVEESVAEGANIDRLKLGRFISVNMVEFAAGSGRTDIARWLINNGADANYKTSIVGETLLMSMAEAGEYELCKLLLEKGADINARDRLSNTALEYALKAGVNVTEEEVGRLVTLLLDNGAVIRRETLAAALNGYTGDGDGDCRYSLVRRAANALLESGEELKLRPALEAAITNGASAVLLINESGVSIQDRQQILFYTAAFGSAETLQGLADNGLELNTADKDGNTPLMLAARYGNMETLRLLISKNPDFYAKNRFGKTAIEIAFDSGNHAIATLLEANQPAKKTVAAGEGCGHSCCSCCSCCSCSD